MQGIDTSIFELLKIGPGPSSSHTIGPMKAGWDFVRNVNALPSQERAKGTELRVTLLGSLSATGKGHGTNRAVVAGLMGHDPEECPAEILDDLRSDSRTPRQSALMDLDVKISPDDVVFGAIDTGDKPANTLVVSLVDKAGGTVFEREYYSVGGGFIEWEGYEPPKKNQPRFLFNTMADIKEIMVVEQLSLREIILANEMAVTGKSHEEINAGLDKIIDAMLHCVESGLEVSGNLPGPLGVRRKAKLFNTEARKREHGANRDVLIFMSYAVAASEENAAGHRVVTAPTCGAAGVMPACLMLLRQAFKSNREEMRGGLLAAAAVGFLCKHNAAIAGAEVGCQGEVGVASAMGSALLTTALHPDPGLLAAHAAEMAIEHHLGLTCDPVLGYVQIPCIDRNAFGAVKAYTAYLISVNEVPSFHKVSLDAAIAAMADSGRAMSKRFKETATGGLAVSFPLC